MRKNTHNQGEKVEALEKLQRVFRHANVCGDCSVSNVWQEARANLVSRLQCIWRGETYLAGLCCQSFHVTPMLTQIVECQSGRPKQPPGGGQVRP